MTQPPPWRTHYATYAPNENGNAQSRERLAGLERDIEHFQEWKVETSERLGRHADRIGRLEHHNSGRLAIELRLAEIPDRTARLEYRVQVILELAKKAALAILLLLAMMGWVPSDVKTSILKNLLPPGIAG